MAPRKKVVTVEYLQRDVFDVHMRYIQTSLDGIRDMSVKIADRLENQERTLYRNTLTVEEHKKRSLHIEKRQEAFMEALTSIKNDFHELVTKIVTIEEELKPIKIKSEINYKLVNQILWIKDNKVLIFKLATLVGIASIIMYILLKDVEAIKQLIKVVF
jgi:hypothetical protein